MEYSLLIYEDDLIEAALALEPEAAERRRLERQRATLSARGM